MDLFFHVYIIGIESKLMFTTLFVLRVRGEKHFPWL